MQVELTFKSARAIQSLSVAPHSVRLSGPGNMSSRGRSEAWGGLIADWDAGRAQT